MLTMAVLRETTQTSNLYSVSRETVSIIDTVPSQKLIAAKKTLLFSLLFVLKIHQEPPKNNKKRITSFFHAQKIATYMR